MNRRAFLAAAPAAVVLPCLAAGAEETPIMKLFREWQILFAEEKRIFASDVGEDAEDAIIELISAKQDALLAEPALAPTDWIAKATVVSEFGVWCLDGERCDELWAEARVLVGSPGFMVAS